MDKNRTNQTNQDELKALEAKLNEKIARAEKLEKSLKQAQKENRERKPRKSFAEKFLLKIILILVFTTILLFLIIAGYLYFSEKIAKESYEAKSAMVSQELVQCAELSTVKMNYSDVVITKRTFLGLGKSYSIIKFNGVARAGIEDISKVETEISPDLNKITIRMPSCTLLSNDISSFEVFDESDNIFVPIQTDAIFAEIEKARDSTSITLQNDGLIKEANAHAKSLLTQVFTAMGFKFVDIQIYDPLDSTTSMGENLENNAPDISPITSLPKGF